MEGKPILCDGDWEHCMPWHASPDRWGRGVTAQLTSLDSFPGHQGLPLALLSLLSGSCQLSAGGNLLE